MSLVEVAIPWLEQAPKNPVHKNPAATKANFFIFITSSKSEENHSQMT